MTESKMHTAKCPHPECEGVLKIPARTPAGDYPCICKSCTVKLAWATYLADGRKPYLALVEPLPTLKQECHQ